MTTQLTTFNFHTLDVRVIEREGQPWFVAADVVRVLAFKTPQMVYARLEPEHKATVSRTDVGMHPGKPAVIINEAGLYEMVLQSRKPLAREFKKWVTGTVLPSIRKTGSYSVKKEVQPAVRKPITTNESETIKLMAQTIDRLTLLRANPLVTVDTDPLITFQQYEANTHQYVEGPTRQHILDTTVGLAKHRGIELAR